MTETYSISNPSHFNGTEPKLEQLQQEIVDSSIATSISYITRTGDSVDIVFVSTISGGDKTTLDGLVSSHVPNTDPVTDNHIIITPRHNRINNSSYFRIAKITFQGATFGTACIISYMDSEITSYDVKIYDSTNDVILLTKNLTNTSEESQDLGTLTGLSTSQSDIEILVKKTGGNNSKYVNIESISLNYV